MEGSLGKAALWMRMHAKLIPLALGVSCLLLSQQAEANIEPQESRAYYERAIKQVERNDLRAAVIELRNALQRNPQNADARLLLGEVYARLGNGSAAEKELRAAERNGIAKERVAVPLGRALLLQGHFEELLRELDPAVFGEGVALELELQRAEAQAGLGRLTEARSSYEALSERYPEDARAYLGLSRLDLEVRQFEAAEAQANAALERAPKLAEAMLVRAEVRRLQGDAEGSLSFYRDAIEAEPLPSGTQIRARIGLASALIALNRDAEAEVELERLQTAAPNMPLASYLRALILVRAQKMETARQILDGAAPALESFVPAQFLFGVVYYAAEELETARSWLMRHLSVQPENLPARKLLGAILLRLNAVPDAVKLLEPGLAQAPDDPQVMMLLGNAYMRSGRPAEATELLERVATMVPEDPRVLNQLALSHLAIGEYDSSLAALSASLDLDAGASTLGYALAFIHLRRGAFEEALKVTQELRARFPDSAVAANLEGGAYAALGDLAQARKSFEAVLEIEPGFHQARANLAALKARAGDVDGAEAEYRRILEWEPENAKALLGLAGVAELRGDKAASRDWLRKAVSANPDDPQPAFALAKRMVADGEMEPALEVLSKLARRQPSSPQVLSQLGRLQLSIGQNEVAIETYQRLVAISDGSADAVVLLARAQASAGDAVSARQTLEMNLTKHANHIPTVEALFQLLPEQESPEDTLAYAQRLQRRYPNEAWPHQVLGDLNARFGHLDKAVAAYEQAWSRHRSAGVAIALSRVRLGQGEKQSALVPLREWLEENRSDDRVRLALAENLMAQGLLKEAQAEYELLKETQANNPVVWNNLAWLYQQSGDPRAVEYGERALQLAPVQPAVMDTLGWILLDSGEVSRATELLQQAHQTAPDNPEIAYHYAVALHRKGEDAAARHVLQGAVAGGKDFTAKAAATDLLRQLTP